MISSSFIVDKKPYGYWKWKSETDTIPLYTRYQGQTLEIKIEMIHVIYRGVVLNASVRMSFNSKMMCTNIFYNMILDQIK